MPGRLIFSFSSIFSFPRAAWECSLRRAAPVYKNDVSLPRRLLNRGLAPEGESLSFAPPRQLLPALLYLLHPCSRKESNQRKGGPDAACFLRSSLLPRVSRRGSCPSADVRPPCRTPNGLFSAKTPVLGAAYGIQSLPTTNSSRALRYASSQAPAWEFSGGSSSFPFLEVARRFEWRLETSIIAIFLSIILSGCTLTPPQQVTDKPEPMPIAQPLGPARRIVQQINAAWADRQESMLAVLELDARHIAMAGLSNDGLSLFNLTYDGTTVVSDKSPLLPESVNPEFIISDLQLVYWPIAELQKKLPADWRLEAIENKRTLIVSNKKQVEVNYLSPDPVWPKAVELVNFRYNYRLNIKTISYDFIPE
jgi:hypothetical protein